MQLIAGGPSFICDECNAECNRIIEQEDAKAAKTPQQHAKYVAAQAAELSRRAALLEQWIKEIEIMDPIKK